MSTDTATRITTDCPRPDKDELTRDQAEERARWAQKNHNPDIRAYLCVCGAWHIGKSRTALNKRIKRVVGSGNHKHWTQNSRNDARRRR